MKTKEREKVLYISHKIELLIWLTLTLLITAFVSLKIIATEKANNDYSIFLPDVDGLIVGSPVRMMGIQVGHVTKIEPVGDEVYVKFLIKNKNIKIPQGTQATVEFSGMAGSKSLELYLPDKNTYIDETVPILAVNPPKRLNDAFSLLNEMFNQLGSIITTTSLFSRQMKSISMPASDGNKDLKDFLQYSNNLIDVQNQRLGNFEKRIKSYGK